MFTIFFPPHMRVLDHFCCMLPPFVAQPNYSKHPEMPVMELIFITGNPNKLIEVKAILGDTVLLTSKSLDLPEIQGTIEEIALDKCRRAADIVGNSSLFCPLQLRTEELPG